MSEPAGAAADMGTPGPAGGQPGRPFAVAGAPGFGAPGASRPVFPWEVLAAEPPPPRPPLASVAASLPDDLRAYVRYAVRRHGYMSISEYLRALIRGDLRRAMAELGYDATRDDLGPEPPRERRPPRKPATRRSRSPRGQRSLFDAFDDEEDDLELEEELLEARLDAELDAELAAAEAEIRAELAAEEAAARGGH
jgi:Arc/MetJ-type ribon-helix-helix transcriptional regulator